jgi:hypothetical protein
MDLYISYDSQSLTAIISLNGVKQLIFVMVKLCVFFAVRNEFLSTAYTSFGFKGFNQNFDNALIIITNT